MTLEDFFAATEMKDGLTTLTRVEELLSVMKATVDSEVAGSSEATRQWAAVGSVLSATEKSECLNHFVQLNGLSFLNQWLQQSHKWSNDGSDDSVENLVNVLLGVLDRLPVDKEKSAASGIGSAVAQLYGHRSHDIRERARTLFNKWNHEEGTDSKSQSGLENGAPCDNGPVNPGFEDSPTDKEPGENGDSCSEGSSGDRIQDVRPPSDQNSPLVSSPAVHHESSIEPVAGFSPGGGEADSRVDDSSGKDSSDGSKDVEIGVNTEEIDTFRDNVGDEGTTGDLKEVEESGRLNDELDSMVSSASLKPTADADINEVERRSEAGLGVSEGDGASEEEDDLPVSKDPLCSSSPERSWGPNLEKKLRKLALGHRRGTILLFFRVQQSYGDASKGNCGFDLNEDISLEEDAEGSSPSSPQRVAADGGEAVPGSALKPNFMDIDLNVVDDDDGVAAGKLSGRGDSSMEVSSGRAERFSVDLNCIGNEDASPHHACGSSGLGIAPRGTSSLRNYPDGYSDFLIMGSRAQDERRELFTENSQAFLGSILCVDLAAGSRRPPPYPPISPPPPPPGYSGLSIGPGSFQYMVDPRGAAVVPQSAADTSSRAAAPSTLTSVGPPTLNLELDCTAALTGGRSLRQLPSSHPAAGTGMVLKRKEPDCGWEPCKLSTNR
ncbi:unnamed protein product [Spirodela intermedia]|uniref:TFIIS N-terminal domain-containing protein n=1 Tax=Spirodela intermedia TaxID=51605 RepID=A0A7I8IZ02_SPIIN|nr:unnamed protein product [Spirodela intermedia]CAA6663216.1 unnamed protein product [Spirodela intermedia]